MSGKQTKGHKIGLHAAALGALLLLSACGTGSDFDTTKTLIKSASSGLFGGQQPPARVSQDQLQNALANATAPLLLVEFEATNSTALMAQIATNGPVATFATGARQTISLENGKLRATRALGDDLMSIERSMAGQTRVMRYLNGASESYEIIFDCTTIQAGAARTETCKERGGARSFTNEYTLSGNVIVASRQWVSPKAGYIKIQRLN